MSDYCEIPDFYSVSWPKAKKEYSCCECGTKILIGEKYCRVNAKWDGDVSTKKQHLDCEEACRYFRDFITHDCLCFGELFEAWGDWSYQFHKNHKHKDIRSIMAKVIWREKKNRPLKFFKPRKIHNESLAIDRHRGWA